MRAALWMAAVLMPLAAAPQAPRTGTRPDIVRVNQHYKAGWNAMHAEHWAEAAREFQQAIDLDPEFPLAYYSLGRADMGLRRFDDAIAAYTKCRELYEASGADTFASQLDRNLRIDARIQELRFALTTQLGGRFGSKTQPDEQTGESLKGQIAQLEEMREHGQNVEIAAAAPFFVRLALGSAYFRSTRLADAEAEYKAAIAANAASGEAHNNLAVLFMTTGRFPEAAAEVALAEKNGVRVSQQFKDDLDAKRKAHRHH